MLKRVHYFLKTVHYLIFRVSLLNYSLLFRERSLLNSDCEKSFITKSIHYLKKCFHYLIRKIRSLLNILCSLLYYSLLFLVITFSFITCGGVVGRFTEANDTGMMNNEC